jgi:hypothetical protein
VDTNKVKVEKHKVEGPSNCAILHMNLLKIRN